MSYRSNAATGACAITPVMYHYIFMTVRLTDSDVAIIVGG
jgi:hypothetical protein